MFRSSVVLNNIRQVKETNNINNYSLKKVPVVTMVHTLVLRSVHPYRSYSKLSRLISTHKIDTRSCTTVRRCRVRSQIILARVSSLVTEMTLVLQISHVHFPRAWEPRSSSAERRGRIRCQVVCATVPPLVRVMAHPGTPCPSTRAETLFKVVHIVARDGGKQTGTVDGFYVVITCSGVVAAYTLRETWIKKCAKMIRLFTCRWNVWLYRE